MSDVDVRNDVADAHPQHYLKYHMLHTNVLGGETHVRRHVELIHFPPPIRWNRFRCVESCSGEQPAIEITCCARNSLHVAAELRQQRECSTTCVPRQQRSFREAERELRKQTKFSSVVDTPPACQTTPILNWKSSLFSCCASRNMQKS